VFLNNGLQYSNSSEGKQQPRRQLIKTIHMQFVYMVNTYVGMVQGCAHCTHSPNDLYSGAVYSCATKKTLIRMT